MKNEFRKWIGDRLRYYRDLDGKNQQEMADALHKKRPAYAANEEGRALPSIITLKRLCMLRNITIDEFMDGSPDINGEC